MKYREEILSILKEDSIKSTNEIREELKKKVKLKEVNWHLLYRRLTELESEGKIESLKSKAGFFWRKK